jgi:acetolactate synthase-1/3 small subunit
MKHTISILVENHAGVLARVAGLFARRGFNIDSLAVGVTEDEKISRITIIADGTAYTLEQIEKQLNKLIDVIKVRHLPAEELLSRELVLIKVACQPSQRAELISLAEIAKAKISDITVIIRQRSPYKNVRGAFTSVRNKGNRPYRLYSNAKRRGFYEAVKATL